MHGPVHITSLIMSLRVFQFEDRWTEFEDCLSELYAAGGQANSYILQIYFVERGTMQFLRQVTAYEKTADHVYSFYLVQDGDRGATVVKVLCNKSECHWFDSSWCHWNFSLT